MEIWTLVAIALVAASGLYLAVSRGWFSLPEAAASGGIVAGLLLLWQRLTRSTSTPDRPPDLMDAIDEQANEEIEEIHDQEDQEIDDLSSGDPSDVADSAQNYVDQLRADRNKGGP